MAGGQVAAWLIAIESKRLETVQQTEREGQVAAWQIVVGSRTLEVARLTVAGKDGQG